MKQIKRPVLLSKVKTYLSKIKVFFFFFQKAFEQSQEKKKNKVEYYGASLNLG
jgi:hypothetical protein